MEVIQTAFGAVHKSLEGFQAGVVKAASVIQSTLGLATVATMGWVTAGVAASASGQVLGAQFEILSRTIAGLFGPEIQKIIDFTAQAVQWFRSLTDEQRNLIAALAKGAFAAVAVSKVMPMLFGGIMMVVGGVKTLAAAFLGLDVVSGGILPLIGALLTGITALAIGTEVGRNGFLSLWAAVKPVFDALKQVWAGLGAVMTPILDMAQQLFGSMAQAIADLLPSVLQLALAIGGLLVDALGALLPVISQAFQVGAGLLKEMMPAIAAVVQIVGGALLGVFKDVLVPAFKSALSIGVGLWRVIAQVAVGLAPLFAAVIELVGQVFSLFVELQATVGELVVVLAKLAAPAIKIVADILIIVVKGITAALKALVDAVRAARAFFGLGAQQQVRVESARREEPTTTSPGGRQELAPRLGGFEALDQTYFRVAQAALIATSGARSHEDEVEYRLGRIDENTSGTQSAVRGIQPAIAP